MNVHDRSQPRNVDINIKKAGFGPAFRNLCVILMGFLYGIGQLDFNLVEIHTAHDG